MSRWMVLRVVVVGLVLTACEARIEDPAGDSSGPDLVEAGVDLQTEGTHFFVRYADGAGGTLTTWEVSTDGDTTPEFRVSIGDSGYGDTRTTFYGDRYSVNRVGGTVEVCSGYVQDGGVVGQKVELTIGSPCLATGDPPAVPNGLRVRAESVARPGLTDDTGWTALAPRS